MPESLETERFAPEEKHIPADAPADAEHTEAEHAGEEEPVDPEDDFQRLTPEQQEDAITKYYGAVKRFILSKLRTEEDKNSLEDFTQETMIKGLMSRHQVTSIRTLRAWLYKIATNEILDKYRKEHTKRRGEGRVMSISSLGVNPEGQPISDIEIPVGGENEQIGKLDFEKIRDKTRDLITSLPPIYQAPLILLSEDESLSNEEIAERLGITVGAVKLRLFRGRQELRKRLAVKVGNPARGVAA